MPAKLNITDEERIARIREQQRERAKRYYQSKKQNNPEFLKERQKKQLQQEKDLREKYPVAKKTRKNDPQPEETLANSPFQIATSSKKGACNGNKYPIMTAKQVQKWMLENPQYVRSFPQNEPYAANTFRDYVSRVGGNAIVKLFPDIKDDFVGVFCNGAKTAQIISSMGGSVNTKQKWFQTIFAAIRALSRGNLLPELDVTEIIKKHYEQLFKSVKDEKIVRKQLDVGNKEYAVPTWDYYEKAIIKIYGKNSLQHLITVLYRYNTVRNDFVGQKIFKKKFDSSEDGFYVSGQSNVVFSKKQHKTSGQHGAIQHTYLKPASDVIRAYIKANNLKNNDVLLPEKSINKTVEDMMKHTHVQYPKGTKPVSVFRNIDSGVSDNWTPSEEDIQQYLAKAKKSKHDANTRLLVYKRIQKDFSVEYPIESLAPKKGI